MTAAGPPTPRASLPAQPAVVGNSWDWLRHSGHGLAYAGKMGRQTPDPRSSSPDESRRSVNTSCSMDKTDLLSVSVYKKKQKNCQEKLDKIAGISARYAYCRKTRCLLTPLWKENIMNWIRRMALIGFIGLSARWLVGLWRLRDNFAFSINAETFYFVSAFFSCVCFCL